MTMYQNCEGLTWQEWVRAATFGSTRLPKKLYRVLRKEWGAGVDPTEWGSLSGPERNRRAEEA